MSRFDHMNPKVGNFRAHLASAIPSNLVERLWGVGLDANGRIVKGAGQSGIVGVTVQTKAYPAGKRIDVMTAGQVVEFQPTAAAPGVGNTGDPGTVYWAVDATGDIIEEPVDTTGHTRIGHTVEGQRLVVRVEP